MISGILEQAEHDLRNAIKANGMIANLDIIAKYISTLTKNEFDSHVLFAGMNGSGKSVAAMALIKKYLAHRKITDDFAAAQSNGNLRNFYEHGDRILLQKELKRRNDCVFFLDEVRTFFDYKASHNKDQVLLMNTIDIARSNRNILIGCTRHYGKLDTNYRNGKLQLVIWLFDRLAQAPQHLPRELQYKVYGAVLIAPPIIEAEDKFFVSNLRPSSLFRLRLQFQKLPSFVGWFAMREWEHYGITNAEMQEYKKQKKDAIAHYGGPGEDNQPEPLIAIGRNAKYTELFRV